MMHRFFRSATHPEYLRYEVEPVLVELEMTTELAPTVAQLMDLTGRSARNVALDLRELVEGYAAAALNEGDTDGQQQ